MDETLKRRAIPARGATATAAPEIALAATSGETAWAPWLRRLDAFAPLVVALVGLAFGLVRLGAPSIWMDEAFSVQLARQPLSILWAAYSIGSESNMVLYHLLLHYWLALGAALGLPANEVFVRLPSVVFAAAGAAGLYVIGRRFLGRIAAVTASVIFVASGWQLTYAQEARGYALQLALVIAGWLALLTALSSRETGWRRWRWWALFSAAMALAVYTQAFSLLILVAQALALGLWLVWPTRWRALARRALVPAIVSFAAVGALIVPFLLVSRHGSKTGWLPSPSLGELRSKLALLVQSGGQAARTFGVVAAVALIAVALLWLAVTPGGRRWRATRMPLLTRTDRGALVVDAWPVVIGLAVWVVAPFVISYTVSLGPTRIFSSRYLIVIWPALCLLIGASVAALRFSAARLITLGLAIVVMLSLAPSYYAHAQVEDWRTPVRWLERQYKPGDGIVVFNNAGGAQYPVDYYLQSDNSVARVDGDSPGAINWSFYLDGGDPAQGVLAALQRDYLERYGQERNRLFFVEGRFQTPDDAVKAHDAQVWMDTHFRYLGQTTSGAITIRLYDTHPTPVP